MVNLETDDATGFMESMRASAPIFHVVLVEPEIPQNTGAIARLCVAARCALHLVDPLGFHLDDAHVRRAGIDHWDQVQLHRHADLESCLQTLPTGAGVHYFSARAERCYTDASFGEGAALVFGRESRGLPARLVEGNPNCLKIPVLDPRVRSLNLANAASIVVYEGLRQLQIFD
jgi:tRNA (cytidine/uridine-2'-O-)-methyltransferase